ncbi:hypothetical protein B0H66DRAFT_349221 [Apodospora peruviana]|uniref:Uncharacterized protein n=1 Tax=Apodospora peruviana TaxID=516989 RepID=A0AAE0HUV0_9PEZI|nr:hypothetical protein B0H66DRAFT_349221 [Apodospora peruviana]
MADNTTDCAVQGNADVYGLGIRIDFCSQWYGTILADWLAPAEVPSLRNTNAFFLTATLIALIILRNDLKILEVCIVLLLFFGSSLYTLLVVYWRAFTCLSERLDPMGFTGAKPRGKMSSCSGLYFCSLS